MKRSECWPKTDFDMK